MNNRMVKAEDIIWRQIGDETVVIKDNGLSTHVLNRTAAYIWELCDGTRDVENITARMCERYDVPSERAHTDVKYTIAKLFKIGLLSQLEA